MGGPVGSYSRDTSSQVQTGPPREQRLAPPQWVGAGSGLGTEQPPSGRGWSGWRGALRVLAQSGVVPRALRILSYALMAALVGVLVVVAVATVPTLFGYHAYIVYGGSMDPSLKLGSVAVGKPVAPEELEVGDVIVRRWSADSSPVLHRIVDITIDDGQYLFTTQGDQNGQPDPTPASFEGKGDKIIYTVPYVGFLFHFARTTAGFLSLVATPIALLLGQTLWKIRGLFRRRLAGT